MTHLPVYCLLYTSRYFLDGYQAPSFFSPTNILLATPAPGNYERVQSATVGEDFTISSKTVNSFHATVMRRVDVRSSAPGINACTLGIIQYCALPTGFQSTVTNKFSTYCGTCAPGHYNDNSLSFEDDVTMVRGKHQFVFGGEIVRNQLNIVGGYESNGNFTIGGQYSLGGPNTASTSVGDADLDFLVGAMSGYQQSKMCIRDRRQYDLVAAGRRRQQRLPERRQPRSSLPGRHQPVQRGVHLSLIHI